MKAIDFVLAGVGGQGILLSSDILCLVGMLVGYDVKKTDVHGMAQRGGSVISHVRLADHVYSPMVPVGGADVLLGFEKLEACRWLRYLRSDGVAVVNDEAIPTLALESRVPYPDDATIRSLLQTRARRVDLLPAGALATQLGNARVANVILLGALSCSLDIPIAIWQRAVAERVPAKARELNLRAFELGRTEATRRGETLSAPLAS